MTQIESMLLRRFDFAWGELAEDSLCDATGSAQYFRVRDEYRASEMPVGVWRFILSRANERADGLAPFSQK